MEKKNIILAICICEVIIIPTVYFLAGHFVILTAIIAIAAGIIIWAAMNIAGKKTGMIIERFKQEHPDEDILYSDIADLQENKGYTTGTLIITEKGISFFAERDEEVEEGVLPWEDISGYKCDSVLCVQLAESNIMLTFKVFAAQVIDEILSKYINRIAE